MIAGALLLAGAAGCSGDSSGKTSAPVATRVDATTLPTGTGIADPRTTTPPSDRRSQPYWVDVLTFSGEANQTTAPFAIDDGTLQWRATWHCDSGSLTAVAIRYGKEERKKLIDALTCPQDGTGYSTATGAIMLKVAAGGRWTIHVEQQIDAPLIEPPPPGLDAAKVVATAQMYDVDRKGEGTVKVYEFPDGSRTIRLEDFFVTVNSDLELRLSDLDAPHSTDEVVAATPGVTTVAPLKATIGNMNYPVPAGLDLAKYHSIVIWCEITRNVYAAASLQPA